ncbi:MAG: lysozyme inhibitor LprI family protein [Methylocella sp.]
MLSIGAVALALCAATGAGLARATDDEGESASAVATRRACLKAKGVHPRDLFSIASARIGDSDVPGTQVDCHDREQRAWDSILNDSYRSLRDSLDDDQRNKLHDMQRAWLEARKRSCEFLYSIFRAAWRIP